MAAGRGLWESGLRTGGGRDIASYSAGQPIVSVRADAETLRSIPIFAECDPVHLQVLAFSSERQQFRAGETVMRQGDTGSLAYLVLDGQADLRHERGAATETIGTAGPGALLGEAAMIGQIPYSLTAVAATPLSAAKISRSLFMRVAEEYPNFGAAVFTALARKLDGSMSDLTTAQTLLDRAKSFSSL
jgi:CRP/FNR family transcriptional regulator, cyclic AMP receptor protein